MMLRIMLDATYDKLFTSNIKSQGFLIHPRLMITFLHICPDDIAERHLQMSS